MPSRTRDTSKDDIPLEERLAECDPSRLIAMIVDLANRDRAAARYVGRCLDRPSGLDIPYYRRWFSSALGQRRWIPYKESRAFVQDVNLAIASMASLLKQGFATEVIGLTEYALKRLEKRLFTLDDSDGLTRDFFHQLEQLHLAACEAAPPPPRQLAKRLFDWELGGDWDTFLGSIGKYAEVLGRTGLNAYGRLVEAAWEQLPAVSTDGPSFDNRRYRLDSMRKALARSSHDAAQILTAWHESLRSSHDYDRLVEALRESGDVELAIEWAEYGVVEYPASIDHKLHHRLAAMYLDRGRGDDALQLLWNHLVAAPKVESYRALMALATRLDAVDAWRSRALETLRPHDGDLSKLVVALMADGDIEHAWQEAQAGNCDRWTLHDVARARAETHPDETLAAYRELVWESLQRTGVPAYRETLALLAEAQDAMERAGKIEEFSPLIVEIRIRHRARTALMAMLDKQGW